MREPIRMVLVDDHELLRAGVRARLGVDPSIEVVGETGTGSGALRLAQELTPDLMLLDLTLPDYGGIELIRELRAKFPSVRSVVLSMHGSTGYMRQAKEAGALGYVVKDGPSEDLTQAIHAVSAGGTYFPHLPERDECPLTQQQRNVLMLMCKGLHDKEVAEVLCISVRTVQSHRAAIRERLELESVAEQIEYARKRGLCPE